MPNGGYDMREMYDSNGEAHARRKLEGCLRQPGASGEPMPMHPDGWAPVVRQLGPLINDEEVARLAALAAQATRRLHQLQQELSRRGVSATSNAQFLTRLLPRDGELQPTVKETPSSLKAVRKMDSGYNMDYSASDNRVGGDSTGALPVLKSAMKSAMKKGSRRSYKGDEENKCPPPSVLPPVLKSGLASSPRYKVDAATEENRGSETEIRPAGIGKPVLSALQMPPPSPCGSSMPDDLSPIPVALRTRRASEELRAAAEASKAPQEKPEETKEGDAQGFTGQRKRRQSVQLERSPTLVMGADGVGMKRSRTLVLANGEIDPAMFAECEKTKDAMTKSQAVFNALQAVEQAEQELTKEDVSRPRMTSDDDSALGSPNSVQSPRDMIASPDGDDEQWKERCSALVTSKADKAKLALQNMAVPDHPLAELLTRKKIDLAAVREKLEDLFKEDPHHDLEAMISSKKGLPSPLFYAVGIRSPALCGLLIEHRADVRRRYPGPRMWNGIRKGMTAMEATADRKLHFKGTVLQERYEAIEDILKAEEDRLRGWNRGRRATRTMTWQVQAPVKPGTGATLGLVALGASNQRRQSVAVSSLSSLAGVQPGAGSGAPQRRPSMSVAMMGGAGAGGRRPSMSIMAMGPPMGGPAGGRRPSFQVGGISSLAGFTAGSTFTKGGQKTLPAGVFEKVLERYEDTQGPGPGLPKSESDADMAYGMPHANLGAPSVGVQPADGASSSSAMAASSHAPLMPPMADPRDRFKSNDSVRSNGEPPGPPTLGSLLSLTKPSNSSMNGSPGTYAQSLEEPPLDLGPLSALAAQHEQALSSLNLNDDDEEEEEDDEEVINQEEEEALEKQAEEELKLRRLDPNAVDDKNADDLSSKKSLYNATAAGVCEHIEAHPSTQYSFEKKIGEGTFGSVRLAKHKETGTGRAIKTIPKMLLDESGLWQEIEIMRMVDHPNIMRLFHTFEDKKNVYMVTEYCAGGELFDALIQTEAGFSESVAAKIVKQMLSAVCYLHNQKIVHRDLKPENFLLSTQENLETTSVKLIDFGTAKIFGEGEELKTKICTLHYVAPEILSQKETPYTEKCDVWSLGVLIFLMLSGQPPFFGDSDMEVLKKIKRGKFEYDPELWSDITKEAKDLINRMIVVNPLKRYSCEQAINHRWVVSNHAEEKAVSNEASGGIVVKLRSFLAQNRLKKVAMQIVAQNLSDDAIQSLRETFLQIDKNNTGFLNMNDMEDAIMSSEIEDSSKIELRNVLDSMDFGQGDVEQVNYTQYLAATLDRKSYLQEEACKVAFNIFDIDGNGSITKEELALVLSGEVALGADLQMSFHDAIGIEMAEIDRIVEEVDQDGDGEINFKEFMDMMCGESVTGTANRLMGGSGGGGKESLARNIEMLQAEASTDEMYSHSCHSSRAVSKDVPDSRQGSKTSSCRLSNHKPERSWSKDPMLFRSAGGLSACSGHS